MNQICFLNVYTLSGAFFSRRVGKKMEKSVGGKANNFFSNHITVAKNIF